MIIFTFTGLMIMSSPTETSIRMGMSRGVVEQNIISPSYNGENPVFEMYTFSLGKHITMIGALFIIFGLFGNSKAVIDAGFIYMPITLFVDWMPVITWLRTSGASSSLFPGIFWAMVVTTVICIVGLIFNARSTEWVKPSNV
jgi:hypothetical protein